MNITALAIVSVIAGSVAALGGALVFRHEHGSRLGWLVLFLSLAVGSWQFATGMHLLTTPFRQSAWGQIGLLSALFIPSTQYHFTCVVTGHIRRLSRLVTMMWATSVFLIGAMVTNTLFVSLRRHAWGVFAVYAWPGHVFVAVTLFALAHGLYLFWRLSRDNPRESMASKRGTLLFWALVASAFGAIDFLPVMGFPVPPLGGVAIALGNVLIAYATWKYRLVELTPAYAANPLLDSMTDGVLLLDRDGVVRIVNAACSRLLGIARKELVDATLPEQLAAMLEWNRGSFPSHDVRVSESTYRTQDGTRILVDIDVTLIDDGSPEPGAALIVVREVTRAVEERERARQLALYDPLTSLPNRVLLRERFTEALARCRRARAFGAVFFIDLDRFKYVNDTWGHEAGDLLLRTLAERITASVRETDWLARNTDPKDQSTVARIGGDEFVLLLSPIASPTDAAMIAERLLENLKLPVQLQPGAEFVPGASIGISIFPEDGKDADALLKAADQAMYRSKNAGRDRYTFFDDTTLKRAAAAGRHSSKTKVRRAQS